MSESYVSTATATKITGISSSRLRKLAKEGKIPYLRFGTRFMFNPVAVKEALDSMAGENLCKLA